jgi:hypothetical protein
MNPATYPECFNAPLTEDEMFEMMKNDPEFAYLPKPARWYKKYNLEPIKARDFKTYLEDDAWAEARAKIISEKIIIKDPQPGGVRPVPPPEEIPVTITSRVIMPEEVWGLKEAQQVEQEERRKQALKEQADAAEAIPEAYKEVERFVTSQNAS